MTLDQIDQMVRQANPVPDLTVLEPVDASVLMLDQQRRTEMQTHDRVEVDQVPRGPETKPLHRDRRGSRHRRRCPGLLAAAR